MSSSFHNSRGFTLLEILVAVTIMAVVFAPLFRLFGGTLRTIEDSEKYAHAIVLAEQKMNSLLFTEDVTDTGKAEGNFDNNPGFTWSTEVEKYDEPIGRIEVEESVVSLAGEPVAYSMKVVVGWREGRRSKKVELVTLKTVLEEKE